MHRATLNLLSCPSCRQAFMPTAHLEREDRIELGYLQCHGCAVVIPIISGIALFSEPLLHAGQASQEALRALQQAWFGSVESLASYRSERARRGTLEPYAAFQPFNESTRTLGPLLPHIDRALSPGDAILDTWCRTGWSGEWLAGRFPENRVISIWEGDSSVLGYRGFGYWLNLDRRASNLDLILTHPERPLPLADASITFLYALDSLHRYRLYPFAGECLRVTKPHGPIVFAHLHLTNSQPEPYFERGCHQFHGRDYRAWLDSVTQDGSRQGWILSEETLFRQPPGAELCDEPDMRHYNGLACLLSVSDVGLGVTAPALSSWRHIVSPLFRFHLGRSSASVASAQHDGMVGHLLTRHPIYEAILPAQPVPLDDVALATVLLAVLGEDHGSMGSHFDLPSGAPSVPQGNPEVAPAAGSQTLPTSKALEYLCAIELVLAAPISKAAHQLQRFHCNQLPPDDDSLTQFGINLTSCNSPLLVLDGGEVLTGADLCRLHAALVACLPALGWRVEDWIALEFDGHPLQLLLAVLACAAGVNVRLVMSNEKSDGSSSTAIRHGSGDRARSLAIGLDGAENSLLGVISHHIADAPPAALCDAKLVVPCDNTVLALKLSAWLEVIAALDKQIDDQILLLDGQRPMKDLLLLLLAVCRQMPARGLRSS